VKLVLVAKTNSQLLSAFQLFFGKLYTYFNIKWVFMGALFIFEVGSLICGIAPSSISFIIGRAIAGVGSAGLFSGAMIIIAYLVPLEKRPIYTGLIGGVYGIASVVGPLVRDYQKKHVRTPLTCCKLDGRCFHRQPNMEMVFLYQPPYW